MSRYDVHLDQAEFRLLRELINEHCGISFGMESRPVVERRLRDRLAALGLSSFSEYYQLLRFDERGKAELDEAIDLVTINETYFFREAYQLRAYKDELLPALRAQPLGRERLSVWCAGCASGEEVYSVAMLTRESGLFPGRSVRVFGSDISRRCLAAARRGVYGPSSFRALPTELRKRYFVEMPDGAHVADDLRGISQFGHLNLLDTPRATVVGRVDVIFCRNVLIYFDDTSRRKVIDMFYDRLLPGGYLLLGHSESLLNLSTAFELVHLREDLVYRKPISSSRFWTNDVARHSNPPVTMAPITARQGQGAVDPRGLRPASPGGLAGEPSHDGAASGPKPRAEPSRPGYAPEPPAEARGLRPGHSPEPFVDARGLRPDKPGSSPEPPAPELPRPPIIPTPKPTRGGK